MSNTTERELEKRQEGHVDVPETQVYPKKENRSEEHAKAPLEDAVGDEVAMEMRVTAALVGNGEPEPDPHALRPELHPTDTVAVVLEKVTGEGETPVSEPVTTAGAVDDETARAAAGQESRGEAPPGPAAEEENTQRAQPRGAAEEAAEAPREHRNPKPALNPLDLVGGGLRYVARRVRPTQKRVWTLPLRVVASELEMTAAVVESKAAHGLEHLVTAAVTLPYRVGRGAWSYGKGMLQSDGGRDLATSSQAEQQTQPTMQ